MRKFCISIEPSLPQLMFANTAIYIFRYVASDGNCYGLEITSDRALGQIYQTPRSQNRVMPVDYLLNSKAYSYLTRIGPDLQQKKASDAQDIIFLVNYMKKSNARPDRRQCRWVVDYDFWTAFCSSYQGVEADFQKLGLQRDATPSSSNRGTRNNSAELRRSMSISSMNH
jgi:hypothetical protein